MAKVAAILKPKRPLRKCPNCNLRTSLLTCPSTACGGRKTIVIPDEGHIA
jgi:rRNA maturation protein Nop10